LRAGRPVLANWQALLLVAPLVALLAGLVGYPLVRLTIDSLGSDVDLRSYATVLESSAGRRALIATVLASLLVAALSVLIGGLLAWYARSARSAWVRTALWVALLVPFFMGTVTKNYALVLLLADNGPLNSLLSALGLGPARLLYSSTGVVIGMVYSMAPFAAFSLYGVFLTIDETLVAAARSMGASRLRAALTVTLPLALPGVLASLALVFAISLGFYVTPVLLGGAQVPFMAGLIQDYIFTSFDYELASAASVILLVVGFAVLAISLGLIGRERLLRAVA
jgi:putative spermidine/putrescine transport system permease protein